MVIYFNKNLFLDKALEILLSALGVINNKISDAWVKILTTRGKKNNYKC